MPAIPFFILVILAIYFCSAAVGESINDAWGKLWAGGTEGKISMEVTDVAVEDDAVVVTAIVTNDDWLSHSICPSARGVLYESEWNDPYDIGVEGPADPIPFINIKSPFWGCSGGNGEDPPISLGGHSSQTVTFSLVAHYWDTPTLINVMRRGGYESFEACGYIVLVDGVRSQDLGWKNNGEHCVVISGPQ